MSGGGGLRKHGHTSAGDGGTITTSHPDLATHDALGLATDAELSTHTGVATAHHTNANDPSSGQKAALAGTSGTPGSGNKYVTDADTRLALTYTDHGNTGSTETVDASVNVHRLVLNAATVTLTLTGAPASGTPGLIRLKLVGDGVATATVVWPGSVSFGDAGEPTMDTTGTVIVDLETEDGGTTWDATQAGRPGPSGADGAVGGAISIPYTFSTTTTDSDPGNGNLRLSNATQTSAVTIRADLLDSLGTTWTDVLDTFADSTNTVKGHIRLFKSDDLTKWLVYEVTAIASPSGYRNITVANVSGSSSSPFSNGDAITLAFTRAGDVGAAGAGSGTVTTVEEVDASPTDSAVTKIVFPNGTLGIAGHVATYTPAAGSLAGGSALDSAGNHTITTTSYAAVDTTNLSVTLTSGGGPLLCMWSGTVNPPGSGDRIALDISVDGTLIGVASGGGMYLSDSVAGITGATIIGKVAAAAGSHTVRLQAKVTAGSGTVHGGGGGAAIGFLIVQEQNA